VSVEPETGDTPVRLIISADAAATHAPVRRL